MQSVSSHRQSTQNPACTSRPRVTLIAAIDAGGVIGAGGGMPWHIPGDLRWFRAQSLHKPILMGRRTFESIGRALPKRRNLVLTRDPGFAAADIERVASVDEAIAAVRAAGGAELAVIGGAQVYALTLALATCLKITRIEAAYRGDTWFPAIDWADWQLVEEQAVPASGDTPGHRFMTWQRRDA